MQSSPLPPLAARRDTCVTLAGELGAFDVVYVVPGAPVSHLADLVATRPQGIVWSVNEKTAVEQAVGSSLAGRSSSVVMKHNGLGIVLDSLANAAVHGIGAPLVIVIGDDPEAAHSTSNVDSRALAEAAGIPLLNPTLAGDVADLLALATRSSALHGLPVIVRVTPRLHAVCATSTDAVVWAPSSATHPTRDDGLTAHDLSKQSRVDHRDDYLALLESEWLDAATATTQCVEPHSASLILCAGDTAAIAPADCCRLLFTTPYPPLDLVASLAADHPDGIVVLEEGMPLVEDWLHARSIATHGRRSGRVPGRAAITSHDSARALGDGAAAYGREKRRDEGNDPALHALYLAIAERRAAGDFVATDVGSAIRLAYPPYSGAEAALSLGSSIAVAAGAARAGRASIAVIGDFGLLHSGIEAVIEASNDALGLSIVVVDNGVQAKTGGQPVIGVDLDALFRSLGVAHVIRTDSRGSQQDYAALLETLAGTAGPAAMIVSVP